MITDGGGVEWKTHTLEHAIFSNIEDNEPITSIKVEDIMQTETSTLNEMFGFLSIQDNIPE